MTGRPGRTGTGAGLAGAGDLLALVRSGRATTRGALQQATGLSRATVGQRLDRLLRAGWLRQGAGGQGGRGGTGGSGGRGGPGGTGGSPLGGRPSLTLEFDDAHAVVLAGDLDTRHARAAVLSLSGEVLAEHTGPAVLEDGPEAVLGELGGWFVRLLERAGRRADEVCGIGLAVPGPVDADTGRVVRPPIMPGWDGHDLRGRLAAVFADRTGGPAAVPVLVGNDADLMAYGEQRTGHPDCPAFVLVKVSTGIGAGIVLNGALFRGADGGAGDIGHIRVGGEALCRCGARGCLAAVASGGAVARALAGSGVPATSGSDVRALLAAGHPAAVAAALDAGRRVGDVLATVVTLLDPAVLMIAGDLAGPPFVTGVRELLDRRALPRSTARLEVVTSRLGERAGLVGAGLLVVEHLYAPARAEERLRALGL